MLAPVLLSLQTMFFSKQINLVMISPQVEANSLRRLEGSRGCSLSSTSISVVVWNDVRPAPVCVLIVLEVSKAVAQTIESYTVVMLLTIYTYYY